MMDMKFSVIIPVYNAEKFLVTAVESALSQPEVGEVILVEDNSPDNSLKICRDLIDKYKNVRLLQHFDGQNHGAAATRNLGIQNAKFEFIAFLDADDYYLPGRFKIAKTILETNTKIDGVYEAIGMHFYNDNARKKWFSSGETNLTTITEKIDPSQLFEALLSGNKGYIHLDGLTVRKNFLNRCGLFFENLRLHQDTALLIQMSLCGKLVPGSIQTPVAMRGIHDNNRILDKYYRPMTRFMLWRALFHWANVNNIQKDRLAILFYHYIYNTVLLLCKNNSTSFKGFSLFKVFIKEAIDHSILFVKAVFHYIKNKISNYR
jgi:glycosyltransferase involved in cell wall biosynthesis